MWSNKIWNVLKPSEINLYQQIRTTFILKRRWEPKLTKKGAKPNPLRGRHFVYDLVKDTNLEKQPNLNLILTSYVAGLGNAGDEVSVKSTVAYNTLLLPRLAVYNTPENFKKYSEFRKDDVEEVKHSSPFAQRTAELLSKMLLSVIMNKDVPWTLEPWHVRASFRKCGVHVAEDAIKIPDRPIKGPDLSLENKVFYVTVTINNYEQCQVKCRIHHWSTDITKKLPYVPEHWKIQCEPLFPEDPPKVEEKSN